MCIRDSCCDQRVELGLADAGVQQISQPVQHIETGVVTGMFVFSAGIA